MRRAILIVNVVAPVITLVLWPYSPLAAIGVLMFAHAVLLYPTLRPNAQWLGPVVTSFATDKREVWLTIDDGPTQDTPLLLDLLDRLGAKATFFVKGTLAEQHSDLTREIVRRGHGLGNHSYSHPSGTFWCLLPAAIRREIVRCNDVLRSVMASPPTLFRAPVGMKNPGVHPVLAAHGMTLIGWSARGFDGTTNDPERVIARLMPDVKPGAILLLHQGRPASPQIIERTVRVLQEQGYAFVLPDSGRLKTKK